MLAVAVSIHLAQLTRVMWSDVRALENVVPWTMTAAFFCLIVYALLQSRAFSELARPAPAATETDSERQLIDRLDDRGAWVSQQSMRYHQRPGPVIDMAETSRNLTLLADYLADRRDELEPAAKP